MELTPLTPQLPALRGAPHEGRINNANEVMSMRSAQISENNSENVLPVSVRRAAGVFTGKSG